MRSGFIVKEEWGGKDGSWMGLLEVPAGIQGGDIIASITRKAKDNVDIRVVKNGK